MKKFTKIIGTIAVVFAIFGIVMLCIGLLGGGASITKQLASNEKVDIVSELLGIKSKLNFVYNDDFNFSSKHQIYKNETGEYTPKGEQIDSLYVQISGGEIQMVSHTGEDFKVDFDGMGKFQAYVEDGTLYVRGEKEGVQVDFGTITIHVPQNTSLRQAKVELGVGTMDVDFIQAENLKLSVGAGELNVERMQSNTTELEVGAGEINIRTADISDLYAEVGMGEIQLDGKILGNIDASVALGEMDLELADTTETEHNYDLSCAAGEMIIGSKNYAGLGVSTEIDHGAQTTYKLDCALGSMKLGFSDGR